MTASYAIDYRIYGLDPRGFHLTNLLAHILCAFLVYTLAHGLSKNLTAAFVAAAVWAVHPTHVENVVWISGRGDILAGGFFFLACCLFTTWSRRLKRSRVLMAALPICYGLALLSKEMAVTLPVLFLGAVFLMQERKWAPGTVALLFSLLLIVTAGYLATRKIVLGSVAGINPHTDWTELLLTLPMVFAKYIGLLSGMVPIDPHHSDTLRTTAWSLSFALDMAVLSAYGAAIYLARRRHQRELLFCLLWFPVTLAPVFNFGGFGDILLADRFLYIPSVGFILAVVFFIAGFLRNKGNVMAWAAVILCGAYIAVNVRYSRDAASYWKNNPSLFSMAVKTSPDSAYIQYSLGKSLSDAEAFEEALKAYDKAIALYPAYVEAINNKAFVLNRLGRYGEALAASRSAVNLQPPHFSTLINTGDSFMGFGDLETAEHFYRASLATRKTAIGHHQLALCLMAQKRYPEAREQFMAALSIRRNPRVLNNLGTLFLLKGETDMAIEYAQMALNRLKPDVLSNIKLEIHYNMARAFFKKGDAGQAKRHMKKIRDLLASGYGTPPERLKIVPWLKRHDGNVSDKRE